MKYLFPAGTIGEYVNNSSQIKEIAFLSRDNRLFIKFHNNDVYSYSPFSLEDWGNFVKSKSKGSYFYKNIKLNKSLTSTKVHNG